MDLSFSHSTSSLYSEQLLVEINLKANVCFFKSIYIPLSISCTCVRPLTAWECLPQFGSQQTDSFCLTALTLAGQVPPVPVCTLLWLVPQTVSCQSHIRLTSYWRQAGLQAVQALDQWEASIYCSRILSTNRSLWWVGGLGVIIESNLNRVRLSCCWIGVGLGCDNKFFANFHLVRPSKINS